MTTDTLIEARMERRRPALAQFSPDTTWHDKPEPQPHADRVFRIRSADTPFKRSAANSLLQERYAWRGYHAVSLPSDQTSSRTTLTATENDETIGTITVALDGPEGLSADDAFAEEMAALRAAGHRVCEFTKLAIDPISGSKRVLAALFHVAYIVAHRMRGYDVLVMEVNPRHVRYYERMVGARVLGEERTNRFVNAPAVLLTIPFDYIRAQLDAQHGSDVPPSDERSIYPFTFSQREEAGIIGRLMAAQTPASESIN